MRKNRDPEGYLLPGPKECWHPYGLQMLRPEQFTRVVNSILRGDDRLLPVVRGRKPVPGVYKPLFGE